MSYTSDNNNSIKKIGRRHFLARGGAILAAGVPILRGPESWATETTEPSSEPVQMASKPVRWDWSDVRKRFILPPGRTYLNSGTEGSMPRMVLENLSRYYKEWAQNPTYIYFDDPRFNAEQQLSRAKIGTFFGTEARNICLTNNTTMGLSLVLMGIDFRPGDEILTTNQEEYALTSTLSVQAKRMGVKVRELPIPTPPQSSDQIVALFKDAITPRTRAMCFSHVTWTNGLQLPAQDLCALARKHKIMTLIDGAQAVGVLDVNMADLGCDFYAGPGHKWLSGPPGTGVLYVRKPAPGPQQIWPILSEYSVIGKNLPITTVLEVRGCNNTPSFLAMSDVLEFESSIGKLVIQERLVALSQLVKQEVIRRWGKDSLFTPLQPEMSSGITAFVPSSDPAKRSDPNFTNNVVTALQQKNIWVRSTNFPNTLTSPTETVYTLRVSTNIFNDEAEIRHLFKAIDDIVAL